jgi:hypothetical protein
VKVFRSEVYPPWRASAERSLPVLVAVSAVGRTRRGEANMLAMVFLDSQSTNYDSPNDLRFAHHVQHSVQKQGRPVPKRSLAQRWLRLMGQSASGDRQSAVAGSIPWRERYCNPLLIHKQECGLRCSARCAIDKGMPDADVRLSR